uniref:DUF4283 domain-containing protein n=1 Tax=Tanacetum cinerariifolium TaxID=118510 RepID=A0A699J5G3_TANCI|nr:hypothetical protein [Tanacetum cinerariifolium]
MDLKPLTRLRPIINASNRTGCCLAYVLIMKRGFLSQKRSEVGRGVKEKQVLMADKSVEKGESRHKGLNFRTLIIQAGIGADVGVPLGSIRVVSERHELKEEDVVDVPVWVKLHGVPVTRALHITAFSDDGLSAIAMKIGTHLGLESYTSDKCIQSWGMSSYARALIEIQADVELKDNIVVAMPKIVRDRFYTGRAKSLKKPSQAPRDISVGGGKKKDVEPPKEVSNSKPFDVVNSIKNDDDFGTNGGVQIWPALEKVGYGTNSLLEQWKESYVNGDYDFGLYDDAM